MLNYIETLPMWVQLTIVFGGLLIGIIIIGAVLYRLVRYGLRIKAGPIEIDATAENDKNQKLNQKQKRVIDELYYTSRNKIKNGRNRSIQPRIGIFQARQSME